MSYYRSRIASNPDYIELYYQKLTIKPEDGIGNKLERSRFCQYPFVHKYNGIIMIIKQGVRVGESACGGLSHSWHDYHY